MEKTKGKFIAVGVSCLLLLSSITIPVIACPPDPPVPQPGWPCKNPADTNEPIFLKNGEYHFSARDVLIWGRGLPVEITRTYGSRREYNSHFGYGWDMNYNLKVQRLDDPDTIVFLNGKGCGYEYTRDVSDPNKFVRSTYPHQFFKYDDVNDTFTLVKRDSIEYAFDANDALSSITDENGNSITFGYDPNGLLTTITDDLDREISLSYNNDGFLETITDFADRTWEYTIAPNTDELVGVTGPTDLSTTYLYDANHNLEYIYDPCNQEVVRNYYNVDDKVWKQDIGEDSYEFDHNPTTNTTTITDREGFVTKMVYGDSGQLVSHTVYTADPNSDPNSFTTTYVYDANLKRTGIVFPAGNCVNYTYDSSGNITGIYRKVSPSDPNSINDPNVIATIYTYDPNFVHKVKTITDAKGNVTTYDYNDLTGDLEKITYPTVTTPDGNESPVISYTYNDYGQIETITAPDEIVTEYQYYEDSNDPNNYGRLWKVIVDANEADPNRLEIITEYEYDVLGRVMEVNDPNGDITQSVYNDLDQLTRTIAPSPFEYVTKFSYDINGNQSKIEREVTGEPNQITSFTYNARNKLEEITDPLGYVTEYGYNKNEDPNLITDAEDHNTVAEYNERRLPWKVTDANGGVTEFSYDDNGNLTEIKDANSDTTTCVYDDFDRLETITYPDDTNEVFDYDKNSSITSKKNRKGETIYYEYDALNRLIVKNRPGDPNITYLYDIAGRVVDINDGGDITTYSYDRIGRVEDVNDTESRVVSYEHDKRGQRTKLVYPDNSYITYKYDALSRLTKIVDDSNTVLAQYTYDELSRRTLVTLGNDANTVYEYDLGNRLKKLTNNLDDTNSIVFDYNDYDKVGNRLSMKVDDANAHIYTYDNLYQLINVDYNDGSITGYYYDSLGNRAGVVDGDGVIGYWKMDDNADNTTVVDSSGNGNDGTAQQNTSALHTTGKIDGALSFNGGTDCIMVGDKDCLELQEFTLSFWAKHLNPEGSFAGGIAKGYIFGSAIEFSYKMDFHLGFLRAGITNTSDTYFGTYTSLNDSNWHLWTMTVGDGTLSLYKDGVFCDDTGYTGTIDYTKTHNNFVIGARDNISYLFEGDIDNVMIFDTALSQDEVKALYTEYTRNSLNQYTSVGGTDYSYDDNGNLTDDGTYDYYYDCENRLMDVNDANGQRVATYSYDYNGRRIYKTINGTITNYCYDGDQVIAEYDANDTLLRKFVYGPGIDEPIMMIDVTDSNAVYYYHFDGLGSVAALSDANGVLVESYSYDVFGEPNTTSSVGNPYMFTGRRYDTETGLYYYRARHYGPHIGRFLQPDPVGYEAGFNLYTYVKNNPINKADPSGLDEVADCMNNCEKMAFKMYKTGCPKNCCTSAMKLSLCKIASGNMYGACEVCCTQGEWGYPMTKPPIKHLKPAQCVKLFKTMRDVIYKGCGVPDKSLILATILMSLMCLLGLTRLSNKIRRRNADV